MKLSKSFVNPEGHVFSEPNALEKKKWWFSQIWENLPFIIRFLMISCTLVLLFTLIGLSVKLNNSEHQDEIGIYLFLILFISLILLVSLAVGWGIAEWKNQIKSIIPPHPKKMV